jgi:hypothetical protein
MSSRTRLLQRFQLGSNVGDVSLSATGGTGTGTGNNGGTITVNGGPYVTLDTAQATAINVSAPAANGNGGTINILAESVTFTGSGYALSANSGTTQGNGGTIDIYYYTTADLNVGSGAGDVEISATGQGTGNGGTVSLTAGNLNVTSADINVSAGSSGNGGAISITGYSGGGTVEIGGTLDASGGTNDGDGGMISLSAYTLTFDSGSVISANGQASATAGGTINLNNSGPTPLNLVPTQIEAESGDDDLGTGQGGIVAYIASAIDTFDLFEKIQLFPGADATPNQKYGKVTHGGITSEPYPSGQETIWPIWYNDATGNTPPSKNVSNFAIGLPTGLKSVLAGGTFNGMPVTTYLFTFNAMADMDPILQLSQNGIVANLDADGVTLEIVAGQNVYIGVAEGQLQNLIIENEVTAHELGHGLDFQYWNAKGTGTLSNRPSYSPTYLDFVMNDWINADYSVVGATQAQSTKRAPCGDSNNNGPLTGVYDKSTLSYYCTNGMLTNPTLYANKTTSEILALSSDYTGLFAPKTDPNTGAIIGWPETYAQAFAYSDYTYQNIGNLANVANPTFDTYIGDGSMPCVQAWSAAIVAGNFVPPSSPGVFAGSCVLSF